MAGGGGFSARSGRDASDVSARSGCFCAEVDGVVRLKGAGTHKSSTYCLPVVI